MNVATVGLKVLNRPWPYRDLAPIETTARRLFRAGARVTGPAHNDYMRDGVRLNGDPRDGAQPAPCLDLGGLVVIAHDNRSRPEPRDAAAQTYRRARRRVKEEV